MHSSSRRDRARHTMTLRGRLESGAQEWHCPECGRLIRIGPADGEDLQVEVVVAGDRSASHAGGNGAVRIASPPAVARCGPGDIRH